MRELGWWDEAVWVNFDSKHPEVRDPGMRTRLLKQGPLISSVRYSPSGYQIGNVPEGSLLFGEARHTRPGAMTVRYTLVQLPDGSKHPICLEEEYKGQDVPPDGIMAYVGHGVYGKAKDWEMAW
jgi:hypothetical protein